jgi:hypothetical protein
VQITWTLPYDGASPITSYTILIRESDDVTFTEESINCDGTDYDIMTNLECFVPISKLLVAPYSLAWGSSIYAKVTAANLIEYSEYSDAGNGAIILTSPDAPYTLVNVPSITAKHQIGLDWESLTNSGGAAVLDFTVSYAAASDAYLVLATGVLNTEYTATGLSTGVSYHFKVQSRNEYGLSEYSNEITVLAA